MLGNKQRRKAWTSKQSEKKVSLGDKCRFEFGVRRSNELNYK